MRRLVLMRGAQGAGKSTFIKKVGWEPYTLSADEIRMQFQSPVVGLDGQYHISATNDRKVWKFLFTLLEERMNRGEFVVIDATHAKTSAMNQYKKLADRYRYRGFVLDLSAVSLEDCLSRNSKRDPYKVVPDGVVENTVTRMHTEHVPGWLKVVSPEDWKSIVTYDFSYHDYSKYKRINHIGDIHGCYSALKNWLGEDMELKPDELYIFVGDYFDRGIENGETFKWLYSIKNQHNVVLLTGNHDQKHLTRYAYDEIIPKRDSFFLKHTLPQFNEAGVTRKQVREFVRKLQQVEMYDYAGFRVLVTHGGFPCMPDPDELTYIATDQFINGVGDYGDDIDAVWSENNDTKLIQIHGHRNIYRHPIFAGGSNHSNNSINLEQGVEHGGYLAVATISQEGEIEDHKIKNDVYDKGLKLTVPSVNVNLPVPDLVAYMRQSDLIKEKTRSNHISSFNFTRESFNKWQWDTINTKARGLFINTSTNKIVNRGYDKFFAVDEHRSTKAHKLSDVLKFPLKGYVKENGYLGLLGYDYESDELVYSSKSAISTDEYGSDYAQWFKESLQRQVSESSIEAMRSFIMSNNVSLLFEVVLPNKDPHIIEYRHPHVVLLDIVYREVKFRKMEYNAVARIGESLGLEVKDPYCTFDNWADFYTWYKGATKNDPKLFKEAGSERNFEGAVLEDQNQFMLKVKFPYYKFWKQMRGLAESVGSGHESNIDTGKLWSPLHNQFYSWLLSKDKQYVKSTDIITLRKAFYKEGGDKVH